MITSEQAYDAGCIELLLDGNRGIYIPQAFCEAYADHPGWSGLDKEDVDACLAGPEHEWYCEAWDTILQNAEFTDPKDGSKWGLCQDGDLWAFRTDVDIEWD